VDLKWAYNGFACGSVVSMTTAAPRPQFGQAWEGVSRMACKEMPNQRLQSSQQLMPAGAVTPEDENRTIRVMRAAFGFAAPYCAGKAG